MIIVLLGALEGRRSNQIFKTKKKKKLKRRQRKGKNGQTFLELKQMLGDITKNSYTVTSED